MRPKSNLRDSLYKTDTGFLPEGVAAGVAFYSLTRYETAQMKLPKLFGFASRNATG